MRKRQEEVEQDLAKCDAKLRHQEHEYTLKLSCDVSKREQNEAAARADKNLQFQEALQKQIEDNVKIRKECSDRSILKCSCKQISI